MTRAEILEHLYILGERWTVIWKDHEDKDWREQRFWGATYPTRREIHLDSALEFLPEKLRTVWVHELIHACIPHTGKNRPKWLTNAREEELAELIDAHLATALAQRN